MTEPAVDVREGETLRPLVEVEKFLTRVWEHPLVDEDLRSFRGKLKGEAEMLFQSLGVDPTNCIAIPVGSVVWGVDSESDYDFLVVTDDFQTYSQLQKKVPQHMGDQAGKALAGEITGHGEMRDVIQYAYADGLHLRRYADVFLTPDDYIIGNPDITSRIRQEAINHLESLKTFQNQDPNHFWKMHVVSLFKRAYQGWFGQRTKIEVLPPLRIVGGWKEAAEAHDAKRPKRARRLIQERSSQSSRPDRWRRAFQKALRNIQVPDFETYKAALQESQGRLNLNLKFAAQEIK